MPSFWRRLGVSTSSSPEGADVPRDDVGIQDSGSEAPRQLQHAIAAPLWIAQDRESQRSKRHAQTFISYINDHITTVIRAATRTPSISTESLSPRSRSIFSFHRTSPSQTKKQSRTTRGHCGLSIPSSTPCSLTPDYQGPLVYSLDRQTDALLAHNKNEDQIVKLDSAIISAKSSSRGKSLVFDLPSGLASRERPYAPARLLQRDEETFRLLQSSRSDEDLEGSSQEDTTCTSSEEFKGLLDLRLWPQPLQIRHEEVSPSATLTRK